MIRRFLAFLVLLWAFGFLAFAVILPQAASSQASDAVVVLTGGKGRIARGLEVMRKDWAKQMFVSGVDREVRPREFAAEYKVPANTMRCCVTLGYDSVDTRSNAQEIAAWAKKEDIEVIRLVTSDWHMRRAEFELSQAAPGLSVVTDPVPTRPTFRTLFMEYHKLLARLLSSFWGE